MKYIKLYETFKEDIDIFDEEDWDEIDNINKSFYTIENHPNKELCYRWIRNNWFDLNEHSVNEVFDSVKNLHKIIGGDLNCNISAIPDRNECIQFLNYDNELLFNLISDNLPLTGFMWDLDVIEGLQQGEPERVLDVLHSDTEYLYSDNGLYELCDANQYEFNRDGSIY
jgi:hypothetical protein